MVDERCLLGCSTNAGKEVMALVIAGVTRVIVPLNHGDHLFT